MNAWLRVWGLAAVCALAACGGDDDDTADADAGVDVDGAPGPDAAPDPLCLDSDDTCGYTPEELPASEMSLADQRALAERFNPAQVFTHEHVWTVSVDYLLVENVNGLEQAEHDGRINFSYDVDEGTRQAVDPQPDLLNDDWSELPLTDGGADLVYFLDVLGDNDRDVDNGGGGDGVTGNGYDDESWSDAWVTAQGGDDSDPIAAVYPPTQYAHLFWLSREDHLLAIQYWFYYPFDKWSNNHEGDWEHVNVVLRYYSADNVTIEGAHFSHHGAQAAVGVDELIRVGDDTDGDHVVVFTGGDSCLNLIPDIYCGRASGASFPHPGMYMFSSVETAAGGTSRVGRPVHATDFDIAMLPRLADMDFAANPNMSWYNLTFIAGAPTVAFNAAATIKTNNHRAPVGPGGGHDEFDVGIEESYSYADNGSSEPFTAPAGWNLIANPTPGF
jgi:hypothetical protein